MVSVMQALVAIIVRNEFCQSFADAGGLELLRDIILDYMEDEVIWNFDKKELNSKGI